MDKEQLPKEATEIKLSNGRVEAMVSSQGAFLESLFIDEKEVVFKPRPDNPKRGGIPILGPTPGPIKEQDWEYLYPKMPSHGTDRTIIWDIDTEEKNKISFKRLIGPKEFLFAGEIKVTIELLDHGIKITKSITNYEEKPRQIGHGFHPYFSVNEDTEFTPQEIAELHPLENEKAEIITPGIETVQIKQDEDEYEVVAKPRPVQTVVWTDDKTKYECVEPWWGRIGKGITIGPRETKTFTLEITKLPQN